MAFVGKSALATGNTSVLPVYATATAGNLLTAFVTANQTTATPFTISGATTGWSAIVQEGDLTVEAEIWWKIAVGSDTMPTWNGGTSLMECEIAEFSTTVTLDQSGGASGTLSPETVTATGIDGGTGRLIVGVRKMRAAAATTTTTTDNVNSLGVGTGINILGSNISTSQNSWHFSFYVTSAVTGSVADNDVATWSATTARTALAIASFAGATVINASATMAATTGMAGTGTEAQAATGTVGATTALSATGTEKIAAAGTMSATTGMSGAGIQGQAASAAIGATTGLSGAGKLGVAASVTIGAIAGVGGADTVGFPGSVSIGAITAMGATATILLPPPVFGPPGKMERFGTQSLHSQPGNQLSRTGVGSTHGQPGNQLERTPPNTLHKQTQ